MKTIKELKSFTDHYILGYEQATEDKTKDILESIDEMTHEHDRIDCGWCNSLKELKAKITGNNNGKTK